MNTGVDGTGEAGVYLYDTTRSIVNGNVGQPENTGYAQNFLVEGGVSSHNGGVNRVFGCTTKYILTFGSTSAYA